VDDVAGAPADEDMSDRPIAAPRDQIQEVTLFLLVEPLAMNRRRTIA
jgi:hypothetical protein